MKYIIHPQIGGASSLTCDIPANNEEQLVEFLLKQKEVFIVTQDAPKFYPAVVFKSAIAYIERKQ